MSRITMALILAAATVSVSDAQAQTPVGSSFTYQGKLTDGGIPASGEYDFTFRLYPSAGSGLPISDPVIRENVQVVDGLFTVRLGFGAVFHGDAMWLGVNVRPGDSTGSYTALSPRQELTPAPYAINADSVALPFYGTGTSNADILDTGLLTIAQFGSAHAIKGTNAGTGSAGSFRISNVVSTAPAVYCHTNGTGPALWADGLARVDVLEISGGSDLAEGFEVAGKEVKPGMVVSIDADKPGALKVADEKNDTKVAGIISGAGGIDTGMIMGQKGTIADGKHPVALTGRVYCYVDATHGAIKPGDLLTTSETPGHAMKVADPAKASGAIIGKAMTALEEGKGLVLVLVNLH